MGTQLATKQPCPACGSSDGATYYLSDQGHVFRKCYAGCGGKQVRVKDPDELARSGFQGTIHEASVATKPDYAMTSQPIRVMSLAERGITPTAIRKYGVVEREDGHRLYPYGDGVTKERVQSADGKNFYWSAKGGTPLFGMNLFPAGSAKKIVICEGEDDAMAGYVMQGEKYPVLSLRDGAAGALKNCQAAYDYLDSFGEIILAFDADAPGREAAALVAPLFVGKAKTMQMDPALKDTNGYLMAHRATEWVQAMWNAQEWRPDGVMDIGELLAEVEAPPTEPVMQWPWPEVQAMTDGMMPSTMIGIVAGTGIGKSTQVRQLVDGAVYAGVNCGMLMLEESPKVTAKRQIGMRMGRQIWRRGVVTDPNEIRRAFEQLRGNIQIYSHLGVQDPDAILGKIRYMVKVKGVRLVVLDHISIIVSGMESDNERKDIDLLMTKLRSLVEETGVCLIYVCHLKRPREGSHEEGMQVSLTDLRGSGAIAQLSDVIIAGERNQQAADKKQRNMTLWRVLKNREVGEVGPATLTRYDGETGRNVYVGPADPVDDDSGGL